VLRVARTIADIDGATAVRAIHVAEAIGARLSGPAGRPLELGAAARC
jgi:predicted ATPase with chaperone activity